MKREEYEERMKDSKYRELVVTNCNSGEDYVFISYRGNSWRTVLTEIVYKLQKEYKLRIYFDKEFASETNIWIEQFTANMNSSHCKAFLCFFDEGYVTSYATLLELMHAMNKKSKLEDAIFPISFPINWGKLDSAEWNTGLGEEDPDNPGWKEELSAFNYEFELLKKREKYSDIEEYHREGEILRACDCKDIMAVIQPKNKHEYVNNDAFYQQHIVEPLKKKCPGVFAETKIPEYKVTIENDGKRTTLQIKEGECIPDQDPRIKNGYEFEGWFVSGINKKWDFSNPIHGDIIIYAKWRKTSNTVEIVNGEDYMLNEKTTLKEFEELCEKIDFCNGLRNARNKMSYAGKGVFDFLIAALLRGCDASIYDKKKGILRQSAYNYNKYAVCRNPDDPNSSDIPHPWTWTSNCRKALRKEDMPDSFYNAKGKIASGPLGENNSIFESLNTEETIGAVLEKFKNGEKGFVTKSNDQIVEAWNLIKGITISDQDSKFGLGGLAD